MNQHKKFRQAVHRVDQADRAAVNAHDAYLAAEKEQAESRTELSRVVKAVFGAGEAVWKNRIFSVIDGKRLLIRRSKATIVEDRDSEEEPTP